MSSRVGAVVVNHDGGEQILRCLECLRRQDLAIEQIVVVDCGSTDGSVAAIRRRSPMVRVVELGRNLGPAVARNRGLLEVRTPLVLLVDDDVYLAPDCTRLLVARLRVADAVVAVPRLLLHPETEVIQADGGDVHFVGTMVLRHARARAASVPATADIIGTFSSSCMLVDRATVLDAGGMDETFFIYLEDAELGLRLRARGHRLVVEPAAVAEHERGAGTPGLSYRDQGAYPRRRAFLTMRNRLQVIYLHYRRRTILILLPALGLYELATLAFAVRRGWFGAWCHAWWWQARHHRTLAKRRRWIQAHRRLVDGELLVGGPLPLAPGILGSPIEQRAVAALSAVLDGYWRLVRRWLGWRPTEPASAPGAGPPAPPGGDDRRSMVVPPGPSARA